ncbi:MAG: hypothetical protein GF384_03140, partial [Elusimicrobia bacterium]|nr:hypothetical protein [Elusimicrobiota bacterium]
MKYTVGLFIVIMNLCVAAVGLYARPLPDFMDEPAVIASSSYHMLGMRDIEIQWGSESLWLSEIFQTWGKKGTRLLWKKLSSDERIKLIESFSQDIEGRKFYFDDAIQKEMREMLKARVNWVPVGSSD